MAFNFTVSLCEMLQRDNDVAVLQVCVNTIVSVSLVWPPSLYCALRCKRHHSMYKFGTCMCECNAVNRHLALEITNSK